MINLDTELYDSHLGGKDIEIDPDRNFGKAIFEFSSITDNKIYDEVFFAKIPGAETGGYLEFKPKVLAGYLDLADKDLLDLIPKVKDMAEILKSLPTYESSAAIS